MTKTLIGWWQEELAEVKALAATWRTMGEMFTLEERIEDALKSIRKDAREAAFKATIDARYSAKRAARAARWGEPPDPECPWARSAIRRRAQANALAAIRDELAEGLKWHRAEQLRVRRQTARILAEWKAEQEAKGR